MTTNPSASDLVRLLNLAKQRGDDYNLLLNRFALERMLCRVAASPQRPMACSVPASAHIPSN
jgi:MinD superfamily P-loop ATPase